MVKKNLCVVIPIYKNDPTEVELLSIKRTGEVFGGKNVFFVSHPNIKKEKYAAFKKICWIYFEEKYFRSTLTYSKLLLSDRFYRKFKNYKYMLIVQTDAYILGNTCQLKQIINKNYDYWGAPWRNAYLLHPIEMVYEKTATGVLSIGIIKKALIKRERECWVGNGGLSLRNIPKTRVLLFTKCIYVHFWDAAEDAFFAYHGRKNLIGFKVAPKDEAKRFALEQTAKAVMRKGIRPFGLHAWQKWYPEVMQDMPDEIALL